MQIEASFKFKNDTAAPVTITRIQSSCGCTTAEPERRTFAAGDTGEIIVKFAFGGRIGTQNKTVSVTSSDGGVQRLEIRAQIEEMVNCVPALVFWRIGDASTPKKIQVQISAGVPARILRVTSSNPRITAELLPFSNPGDPAVISVAPRDTSQKESADILIMTDWPLDAPKAHRVFARIK